LAKRAHKNDLRRKILHNVYAVAHIESIGLAIIEVPVGQKGLAGSTLAIPVVSHTCNFNSDYSFGQKNEDCRDGSRGLGMRAGLIKWEWW
jgi:hypothetical protein